MRKRMLGSMLLLMVPLSLAACGATLEIGIEGGSPTATSQTVAANATQNMAMSPAAEGTRAPATLTATSTLAPSPTATTTPSAIPTATDIPSPTVPPTQTPTPRSTARPTSTGAPTQPEIVAFGVYPSEAEPGETVTLTWEARGDRAKLCPTARYVLFTSDDCQQVPTSGATLFTIPEEAAGFQYIDFTLTVETLGPAAPATGQVSVALRCDRTWFFSKVPQAGICPLAPHQSYAAAQHFERGAMIWLEQPGRYYVLDDALLFEGESRKRVDIINDPLELKGDTSAAFNPPPGRYAPVSGFGLVWRGDVAQSAGYEQRLGWALEPEFGYQAILQCDDARPSGGRSWQTCYLKGPDGEVIVLHPLGGWQFLEER